MSNLTTKYLFCNTADIGIFTVYVFICPCVSDMTDFNPKKIKLPERAMLKNKKAIHCGQRVRVHCPSDYKHLGAKRGTVKSRNKIKWKGKTPKCVSA